MDTIQLKCFKAAAMYESITKASNELFIPQPTVSKQIRSLEAELDYELFDRKGKHIFLNNNGKIFLKYLEKCDDLMEDCQKEIMDQPKSREQSVSLLVLTCSIFLPDIMQKFSRLHPEIRIRIDQSSDYERKADLSLFSQAEQFDSSSCVQLLKEEICLCVPLNDPLAKLDHVDLKDIKDRNFIMLKPTHTIRKIIDPYFQKLQFSPNIIMEVENPLILRQLISSGFGLSIAPAVTWKELSGLNAKLIPLEGAELQRRIYLSWCRDRYLSYPTRLLRDFLIDYFARLNSTKRNQAESHFLCREN